MFRDAINPNQWPPAGELLESTFAGWGAGLAAKHQIWLQAYLSAPREECLSPSERTRFADECLEEFTQRFPKVLL